MVKPNVVRNIFGAVTFGCALGLAADQLVAQSPATAVLLVIDKESVEYGVEQYQAPPESLNEVIAGVGVRDPLPFFAANVGRQFYLRTAPNGNDSWFAFKSVPHGWASDAASDDGLQNFVLAGPGLGSPDANGDRESLLDLVTDVTPVRNTANLLVGRAVCAVIYDNDLTVSEDGSVVSLRGANLGLLAFRVNSMTSTSAQWPTMLVEILEVRQTCSEALELLPQPALAMF